MYENFYATITEKLQQFLLHYTKLVMCAVYACAHLGHWFGFGWTTFQQFEPHTKVKNSNRTVITILY